MSRKLSTEVVQLRIFDATKIREVKNRIFDNGILVHDDFKNSVVKLLYLTGIMSHHLMSQ
jgi:hypothetical protein